MKENIYKNIGAVITISILFSTMFIIIPSEKVSAGSYDGEDLALALWNIDSLELIIKRRKAHQKKFEIGAHWGGKIITVCYSCGEMKMWDGTSLEEKKTIAVKPCLTGEIHTSGTDFFLASRAINGIELARLDELVE